MTASVFAVTVASRLSPIVFSSQNSFLCLESKTLSNQVLREDAIKRG